ncbi:succinyldiaminopimelate transaminase [Cupriavidus sp. 8B]
MSHPLHERLQPYPTEKLLALAAQTPLRTNLPHISFSWGEPQHPTPRFIVEALGEHAAGIGQYPKVAGSDALREAIAAWIARRHGVTDLDAAREIVPVNGSKDALFSVAQVVLRANLPLQGTPVVLVSNPGYQVYEGAALLAGAEPYYLDIDPASGLAAAFDAVPSDIWPRVRLAYLCSPDNPSGRVYSLSDWAHVLELAERHGFHIVADECYSELYFDEDAPPLGVLAAARALGRDRQRILAVASLSKRSNAPGLRSGFVAGDAEVLVRLRQYRSYSGGVLSPAVQGASIAAWQDEAHVVENRRLYREKFAFAIPRLRQVASLHAPQAGFFAWLDIGASGLDDVAFTRELLAEQNLAVVPGSYLARTVRDHNPGVGHIRIALVASPEECAQGVERLIRFVRALQPATVAA